MEMIFPGVRVGILDWAEISLNIRKSLQHIRLPEHLPRVPTL